MHVLHTVAGMATSDGGPSHTLPLLWSILSKKLVNVSVCTTRSAGENIQSHSPVEIEIQMVERSFPKSLKWSNELDICMSEMMKKTDLCHNHGCWLYPNWLSGRLASRMDKPLLISPLGHLDSWSLNQKHLRKGFVRFFVEEENWRYASAFIAKSEMEADSLRSIGIKSKIAVIPNGIESGLYQKSSADDFLNAYPYLKEQKLLLFMSRIHPKKGVLELLKSWKNVRSPKSDWHLVIAGDSSDGYALNLETFVRENNLGNCVSFVGPLDRDLKYSALRAASLFVLPSYSENFGQVILEALSMGVPVITTQACPWPEIVTHDCGWWIKNNGAALEECLKEALRQTPEMLSEKGKRGQHWVAHDFNWENIADRMIGLYKEVLK